MSSVSSGAVVWVPGHESSEEGNVARDRFDYIVVGAGAAGSVLADRLSADGRSTVLVLESGGADNDPLISMPKGFFFLYGGTRHSFIYHTGPAGPSGASEVWQRGRVDGGSTSINGMGYDRGNRQFWDTVAGRGLDGWDWDTMLPLYLGIENHELGASPLRGAGGPLDVSVTRPRNELTEVLFDALGDAGIPRVEDLNAAEGQRAGFVPSTIRHGRRRSTAKAFLDPARRRPNMTYLRHAHVGTVLFEGTRAVGVRARVKGQLRDFHAGREVVVSAGAIETPQLLERSGIGAGAVLSRIGVRPVVENPNVGEHVIEQRAIAYQAQINRDIGYNKQIGTFTRQILAGARYLITHGGNIGTGAYDIGSFGQLHPDSTQPDTWLALNPLSLDLTQKRLAVSKTPGFSIMAYPLSPVTESSIHAGSADPDTPPIIDPHYLEQAWEQELTLHIIEAARRIAAQHPLADLFVAEQAPGPAVATTEQAVAYTWANSQIAHSAGSARMAPTPQDGVVDAHLRVFGTEGLRVADVSVLPRAPGNTMAPTIGVGARAAGLILADRGQ